MTIARRFFLTLAIYFASLFTYYSVAQNPLTFERIYSNYEFYPDYFGESRWVEEGNGYTTLEYSGEVDGYLDLIRYETSTGNRSVLISANQLFPPGASKPLYLENYEWSSDKKKLLIYTNSKRVWRLNTKGDYWLYDMGSKKLTQLGKGLPESTMMFAKFSPDDQKVAYVSQHNLYMEDLTTNEIKQITFDGTDKIINGTFDWAYEEEFFSRDGFRWSPDSKKIAYWQLDASGIGNFLMINNTDSLYSFTIPVQYPKVGTDNSSCKVGVISADGGKTTWMQIEGDPKNNYIPRMQWAANSDEIVVQQLNRRQDHNKVISCKVSDGSSKVLYEDKETTWLDVVEDWKYLYKGKNFTWVSEKSGWRKVYSVARDGQKEKSISTGDFDVIQIQLIDEKGGYLYYTASPENATQKYLYRNRLSGKGSPMRLTPATQPGTHDYDLSPNGKWALHYYSSATSPRIVELISLPDHKVIRTLIDNANLKEKVADLNLSYPEFLKLEFEEYYLDAYIMKPQNFDESKKYPVIFYVYGEPWNQTVKDSWGGSRFLYHNLLTQQGYIVASIDNRGTPGPKGRDWRKAIHAKLGVVNAQDQAEGAKKMLEKFDFMDAERVGIWGWSGGGTSTLNAMFKYGDIYKTGVSVAPVPDIRLYDNIYQERYSGLLWEKENEYKESVAINYAKNLKGNLMIIHGTGDDNVHYQGTERLINELIRHNKIFSMIAYPNRSHGIYEGKGTTRHLHESMFNYWINNLEAGGK